MLTPVILCAHFWAGKGALNHIYHVILEMNNLRTISCRAHHFSDLVLPNLLVYTHSNRIYALSYMHQVQVLLAVKQTVVMVMNLIKVIWCSSGKECRE